MGDTSCVKGFAFLTLLVLMYQVHFYLCKFVTMDHMLCITIIYYTMFHIIDGEREC